MNLPAGAAIQGGGMAAAQFQRIAWVGEELVRFADDAATDADPPRQNPLLGTAFRCVGMLSQQPIQQRADQGHIHVLAVAFFRHEPGFNFFTCPGRLVRERETGLDAWSALKTADGRAA